MSEVLTVCATVTCHTRRGTGDSLDRRFHYDHEEDPTRYQYDGSCCLRRLGNRPTAAGGRAACAAGADRGGGSGRGGRGGGGGRAPRTHKVVLAWADTRNGIAQHDFTSHALAMIERLGYESGLWDTYIRTDSNIVSYHPLMTTGQPASGGPSLATADAIFFMGHREIQLDDQQKADLLKFVHDDGKGFVAAHVALTALNSWPEFGEMLGGSFDEHPYGSVPGNGDQRRSGFPGNQTISRHLCIYRRVLPGERILPREKPRAAAARYFEAAAQPGRSQHQRRFPAGMGKDVRQGPRLLWLFRPRRKELGQPDVYHMYFEAIRWALGMTDADVTPRPYPEQPRRECGARALDRKKSMKKYVSDGA